MIRSLIANFSLGVALTPSPWALLPFLAALLAAGMAWSRKGFRHRSLGILLCWLLVPIAAVFLVSLRRPMFTARYLIIVLPAYLLLLAVGLTVIGQRATWLAGILMSAVLVISAWGLSRQMAPIKSDFRGATKYIMQRMAVDDLVLFQIPYGRHSFEFYMRHQSTSARRGEEPAEQPSSESESCSGSGMSWEDGGHAVLFPWVAGRGGAVYRWAEGLFTNQGMNTEQVDQRMRELVDGSRVVWFVATEVPLWDERGLVQAWLDRNGVLVGEANFVRVLVRRYKMP
jgi:hypothetical protein